MDDLVSDIPDLDAIADNAGTTVFELLATTDPVLRRVLDAATERILDHTADHTADHIADRSSHCCC